MAGQDDHRSMSLRHGWLRRMFGSNDVVRLVVVGALCTIVPDLDVIGRHLDIAAGGALAHRGATHSLAFAAVLAAVLAFASRKAWRVRPLAVFAFLFTCTASHGLLDMLTSGGPGVMLGWPFVDARGFFPWRPIVVSPLDAAGVVAKAARLFASEARWVWAPGLVLAALGLWLAPRRTKAAA
jgi:inner membrane protein